MSKKVILECFFILCLCTQAIGQNQLNEFDDFKEPVGDWVMVGNVQLDASNPNVLIFEKGSDCFVNGVNGKAKYLVTEKEYQDFELHLEFMLPKGSNSGVYFQCRYEVQLFDSWGATALTYYDCGGIQQGVHSSTSGKATGFDGYPPLTNACKAPGVWQKLDVIFRAPRFNSKGAKIKNAVFEKVVLNGVVVQENAELPGPTKGALSEIEVAKAPFRLQGGHGPVAFRNIITRDLEVIKGNPEGIQNE